MVNATVTNVASFSIGPAAGTDPLVYDGTYPPTVNQSVVLPGAMAWATIAPSGNKVFAMSISDLDAFAASPGFGGLRVKDVLQQMIQMGMITVTYAQVGVTDRETLGKAIVAS